MAQATGRDARDILGVPQQTPASSSSTSAAAAASTSSAPPRPPAGPPTLKKTTHKSRARQRQDGIQKELQALLGDNAPSLAIAHTEARAMLASQEAAQAGGSGAAGPLRPKFKRKDRKPQAWKWQPFTNPARSDGLRLNHWAPAAAPGDEEDGEPAYLFAAFNTTSGIYTYSNDEYAQHLKEDDWTKDDTDHLIDLCQSYDLRFVVIADRWEPPSGRSRTIEDLKARYYAICRRLIRSRISVEDMDSRQQLLATYSFDKPREVERKRLVNKLFTRTPAQLAEEEALYVEARRLEQNEARFASERENLMKLLGGHERIPECELGSIAEAGAGVGVGSIGTLPGTPGAALEEQAALQGDKRKRKRATGEGGEDVTAATASTSKDNTSAPATLTSKQKAELKQAHHDELHCITRFDPDSPTPTRPPYPFLIGIPSTTPPIAPSPSNPTSSHGVYLRSTRLLTPRQAQLNRTMQTLAELNPPIGPRLVFPTRTNCEKWEGLLGAVTSGLEMKKGTDRVESELRIARGRLAGLLGEKEKSGAQGGSGTGGGNNSKRRGSTPRVSAGPPTRRSNSVSARSRSSRSRTPAVAPAAATVTAGGDDSMEAGSTVDAAANNQGQKKRRRSSGGLSDLDDDEDDDDWKDAHAGGVGDEGGQAGQAGDDD